MTPGFERQSTASHDGCERGSGSNSVAILSRVAARFTPGRGVSGTRGLRESRGAQHLSPLRNSPGLTTIQQPTTLATIKARPEKQARMKVAAVMSRSSVRDPHVRIRRGHLRRLLRLDDDGAVGPVGHRTRAGVI